MALIGFRFDKFSAEKKENRAEKLQIKNNISIKEIRELKLKLENKEQFSFHFGLKYEEDIASVDLYGKVVYTAEEKKIKEIMTKWKDGKKLIPDVMEKVYNYILTRCNVQAISIEKDIGLPPHIAFPRVNYSKDEKNKKNKKKSKK